MMTFIYLLFLFTLFGKTFATNTEEVLHSESLSTFNYEELPFDMKEKINEHLTYITDKINIGLTNKANFEAVQQKVKWFTMTLPLHRDIKTPPSVFYCNHLKNKKNLRLVLYFNYIFSSESQNLAFSYFKCLTNVENLKIIEDGKITFSPAHDNHHLLKNYFPRLKSLEMTYRHLTPFASIPNSLTHLKIFDVYEKHVTEIEEKIKELDHLEVLSLEGNDYKNILDAIVPLLNKKKSFRRLILDFKTNNFENEANNLFMKPETITFAVDLNLIFYSRHSRVSNTNFIDYLPKTIENLEIKATLLEGAEPFCKGLSKMKKLKTLKLDLSLSDDFKCVLDFLPDTLTELILKYSFDLTKINALKLPISLKTVVLVNLLVTSQVFVSFAEKVEYFDFSGDIIDPDNLILYYEPFNQLKVLKYSQYIGSKHPATMKYLEHFYDLLPNHMEELDIEILVKEKEWNPKEFKDKIWNRKSIAKNKILFHEQRGSRNHYGVYLIQNYKFHRSNEKR